MGPSLTVGPLPRFANQMKILLTLTAYCLLFMHRITTDPGDGIGPEVASAVSASSKLPASRSNGRRMSPANCAGQISAHAPEETNQSSATKSAKVRITNRSAKDLLGQRRLRKALELYANLRAQSARCRHSCRNPELDLVGARDEH